MVSRPKERLKPKTLLSRSSLAIWLIIFLIALISRFIFLISERQLPVFWDARLYASAAVGLLGFLDRDEPYGKGENTDEDFVRYYRHYLDGEEIHWLYYKVPSLAEAQKYVFYSGPVYPALLAAIFALDWDRDFQVVRFFNAFLDSLTIVVLTMLAFVLWGRAPAIIAGVIQLLYLPSILTCGILALETITSFLISIFLFSACLYYYAEKKWLIVLCGFIGGLLVLTKPTASLLTVPLFVFFIIEYFGQRRRLISTAVFYFVPFLFLVLPWIIFTSDYYGQPAFRDPDYSTANIRASSSIDYEGYDLDYSDPDFWTYSIAGHIFGDPIGYVNLLSKKIIRMWWMPHDEFWQGPKWFELTYHRFLIILALMGIAATSLIKNRFLLLPVLIIGYYGGIHIILHSLPRYNFNAMLAVFILIPGYLQFIHKSIRDRQKALRTVSILVAAALLIVIINAAETFEVFLSYLNIIIPLVATVLLLLLAGYFYVRLVGTAGMGRLIRLVLWCPFILLSVTAVTGWTRPQMAEWHTPLRDAGTKLVTEIHLPPGMIFADNDAVKLVIDLTTDSTCTVPVEVVINGLLVQIRDGQPPMDKAFFTKGTYRVFKGIMNLDVGGMRWYRSIGLSPADLNRVLAPDGILAIGISFGNMSGIGNGLRLYGDPTGPNEKEITVPSFSHRSIERFRELGDRRMYENYTLSSKASFSYIFRDGEIIADDLSPLPGAQKGRYRVYLVVKGADFGIDYY